MEIADWGAEGVGAGADSGRIPGEGFGEGSGEGLGDGEGNRFAGIVGQTGTVGIVDFRLPIANFGIEYLGIEDF